MSISETVLAGIGIICFTVITIAVISVMAFLSSKKGGKF